MIPGLNIDFGTLLTTAAQGVILALAIMTIAFICYLIYFYFGFNISVFLFEKIGEGYRLVTDRGKLTVFNEKAKNPDKKDGEYKAFQKKSFKYPYPDSNNFFFKGAGKALCGLVKNGSVTWLKISENAGFIPADMNMLAYLAQRLRRNWDATQNKATFWDKYGHQVLWVATIAIFMICIILILKEVHNVIEMGKQVGSQLADAAVKKL